MSCPKRLAQMAKKWQRMAALRRKRITTAENETDGCSTSVAGKGHCVVYTADGGRFEVPLAYLRMTVFGELLRSDGRITLPCDAAVMEYIMCLLRRSASAEVDRAFLSSMVIALPLWKSCGAICGTYQ